MRARPSFSHLIVLLLGLIGAAWCVYLFIQHGIGNIVAAVVAAGWGVVAVIAFHAIPLLCDVISWSVLIPKRERLPLRQLYFIRWMGDSVSSMLPVAQVGGELVRVRLSIFKGMSFATAASSVLVGITISVFTQVVFALTGLWLLLLITGRDGLARPVIIGSIIGIAVVAAFYLVQRAGMFRFAGAIIAHFMKSPEWQRLATDGHAIDTAVRDLYSRPRALLACGFWTMAAWATGAIEVWIAMAALRFHTSYAKAYVLESASQTIRSVFFLLPGALGAQEGGYLAIGALLGISSQIAMALALIRRVRELVFGLPGVMSWQWMEWRRLRIQPPTSASATAADDCAIPHLLEH
jgi:putative membrane protein